MRCRPGDTVLFLGARRSPDSLFAALAMRAAEGQVTSVGAHVDGFWTLCPPIAVSVNLPGIRVAAQITAAADDVLQPLRYRPTVDDAVDDVDTLEALQGGR